MLHFNPIIVLFSSVLSIHLQPLSVPISILLQSYFHPKSTFDFFTFFTLFQSYYSLIFIFLKHDLFFNCLNFNPIIVLFSSRVFSSKQTLSVFQSYYSLIFIVFFVGFIIIEILFQSYYSLIFITKQQEKEVQVINFNPIIVLFSSCFKINFLTK